MRISLKTSSNATLARRLPTYRTSSPLDVPGSPVMNTPTFSAKDKKCYAAGTLTTRSRICSTGSRRGPTRQAVLAIFR